MRWDDVNTPPRADMIPERSIRRAREADSERRWRIIRDDPTRLVAIIDGDGTRHECVASLIRTL